MTDFALDSSLTELEFRTDARFDEVSSSATGLLSVRLNSETRGAK